MECALDVVCVRVLAGAISKEFLCVKQTLLRSLYLSLSLYELYPFSIAYFHHFLNYIYWFAMRSLYLATSFVVNDEQIMPSTFGSVSQLSNHYNLSEAEVWWSEFASVIRGTLLGPKISSNGILFEKSERNWY